MHKERWHCCSYTYVNTARSFQGVSAHCYSYIKLQMKEAGDLAKYSVYIEFINGKVYEFETANHPLYIKPIHVIGAEVILTEEDHAFNRLDVMKMDVREIGNEKIDYFYRGKNNKNG